MLATHSLMGSNGQQSHFPFGYLPDELHGIGLPDYMAPGPPPSGQPLLNENENQTLTTFFNGFDASHVGAKDTPMQQYTPQITQGPEWSMPPTFVGSETSLRSGAGHQWHQAGPVNDLVFGTDVNMGGQPQPQSAHTAGYVSPAGSHSFTVTPTLDRNLVHHLHTAAQSSIPAAVSQNWSHGFADQSVPRLGQPHKPDMRFGSDDHFQSGGYSAPPAGGVDQNNVPSVDWIEGMSSTSNTQPGTEPNTRPNTQPSSPTWAKKRKVDTFQSEPLSLGSAGANGHMADQARAGNTSSNAAQRKRSLPKQNRLAGSSQPATPVSATSLAQQLSAHPSDSNYDEELDSPSQQRSPSPGSWPSNNAKPAKGSAHSPKSAKPRSKHSSSTVSANPKNRLARSSSSLSKTPTARVPLTAAQKKANHTNSEQRRRDATARAYADLYDLVPELDGLGKQSTMKKLEVVVAKVSKVRKRVAELRALLGYDQDGKPLDSGRQHPHPHQSRTQPTPKQQQQQQQQQQQNLHHHNHQLHRAQMSAMPMQHMSGMFDVGTNSWQH